MHKYNPIVKIVLYKIDSDFHIHNAIDEDVPWSEDDEMVFNTLPENVSNQSKTLGGVTNLYQYAYTFNQLNVTNEQRDYLKFLSQNKCIVNIIYANGSNMHFGNNSEPVTLSITEIDDKLYKNISGYKIKLTCKSILFPKYY